MSINSLIKISAVVGFVVLIASCQEVGPNIDLGGKRGAGLVIDTAYSEAIQAPETKNVLIEDFTGIRCINCPNAQQELMTIITANTSRVIGISHHSLLQDEAFSTTRVSITSGISQKLEDLLVYPGFKPNGAIDRANLLPGTSLCYGYLDWANLVDIRKTIAAPVNITMDKNFSATSGDLTIDVKMHYTQDENTPNKLTVFIVEDSIVTAQLLPNNTIDDNYVHNHVLRLAISDTLGDRLNHDLKAGTTVRHVYQNNISNKGLEYRHLKVIAFVHRFVNSKEILQVKEIKIGD